MSIMDPTGETCDHEWIYDADRTERECMARDESQYRIVRQSRLLISG
ncbi:MAG: hypothetical protein OXC95_07495 [Dehalococcoidia bacterium]|nr:hypothetical protein [Dehalococcoidia bacterium]